MPKQMIMDYYQQLSLEEMSRRRDNLKQFIPPKKYDFEKDMDGLAKQTIKNFDPLEAVTGKTSHLHVCKTIASDRL